MAGYREMLESLDLHEDLLYRFLKEFTDDDGKKKYINHLQKISDGKSNQLCVSTDDVIKHFGTDEGDGGKASGLIEGILLNSKRYLALLYTAAEKVKSECAPSSSTLGQGRISRVQAAMEQAKVPVSLRSGYEVRIQPPASDPVISVREVRACHVGALVKVSALVTKVTSVKPRIQVAAYRCDDCGSDVFQAVEGPAYMPLAECNAAACVRNKTKGDLQLSLRESKFVKYQEVTIQEPSSQVPPGCIPRNSKVIAEGELARQLSPGVSATLSGIFLPVQKTGFAAMRQGLVADTYFEVHQIEVHKKGYEEELAMDDSQLEAFLEQYQTDNLYERLAQSVAPAICGLEDVKKAVLLQLVGGVTESFSDKMKIRGDIHLLLMGDPGVAKSQLLRQICNIAPRAHFTTGKGSSGVGLTASVTKDPVTGEFTLEGGAIVLADNGVCCIDEFDKMDESDRTAIHEVMEQQTVSVAKAGLTTTLNARTSILAAANPVYGRYDLRKSPVANMNLPAALLSRFDIQYLLLDKPDVTNDTNVAKHVLHVHRFGEAPKTVEQQSGGSAQLFDARTMRIFIARARRFSPKVQPALISEIVEHYVSLRRKERQEKDRDIYKSCTTPRTLLAILRMSQALARLRCSNIVERGDFEEALRLMQSSKDSVLLVDEDEENGGTRRAGVDFRSEIMEICNDIDDRFGHRSGWQGWIDVAVDIEPRVHTLGFTPDQVLTTLEEYVELDVLIWKDADKKFVGFVERLEAIEAAGDA